MAGFREERRERHGKSSLTPGNLAASLHGVKDYSLADLVRLTGYSDRRIRQYIESGHLPRPKLAGSQTRYSREALGRLSAILVWRKKDKLGSAQVARTVRALTPEEIEDWAEMLDPETPPESGAPPEPADEAQSSMEEATAASTAPLILGERWVRVLLVPGLELMMREGSGELVERLAREIQMKYRAAG